MNIRNFLFSNRSFTPVPIAFVIIYLSDPSILYFIYGMPLILVGELIRINAVSHAGGITRTMNVGAPSLCTSGPYSRTRNPLYLGNMIIYLGIVLVAGGEYVFILEGGVFLYFTFQYMMIISLGPYLFNRSRLNLSTTSVSPCSNEKSPHGRLHLLCLHQLLLALRSHLLFQAPGRHPPWTQGNQAVQITLCIRNTDQGRIK